MVDLHTHILPEIDDGSDGVDTSLAMLRREAEQGVTAVCDTKLNPLSLGLMNAKRDKKKTLSVISSLSLGGILLLIISSIALTQSPERIARQYFPDGDYKIYNNADSLNNSLLAGNPLNEEVRQEILSIDGVTDIIITRQSAFAEFSTEHSSTRGV